MHAVIMAGGEGSRLRPLTCDRPKPMVRLCGRPIMHYILDLLDQHGFDTATVTLGYLADVIQNAFPTGQYKNVKLRFVKENMPLGTAGGVRNAAIDCTEDFLVISGDALCDFDLQSIMKRHKESGAAVTIVCVHVDDPREYGLVNTDAAGHVTGFTEKPPWSGVTTDLANTGIYVIRPDVMRLIPPDKPFDFAKDLFPLLLKNRMPMLALPAEGYWCDIGDLTMYRTCQHDMLEGRVSVQLPRTETAGVFGRQASPGGKIFPPVYIGERVQLSREAVIGPHAVLDDGVRVDPHARVRGSVILPNTVIGPGVRLTGVIVGENAMLERDSAMYEDAVLGTGATLGEGADVQPGVGVWPNKTVMAGTTVRQNMKSGSVRPQLFSETGIEGPVGMLISPAFCARVGSAVGSLKSMQRVGVGYGAGNAVRAMAMALMAGLASTGVQVLDFGCVMACQLRFAASFAELSCSLYVGGHDNISLLMLGADGLPVENAVERALTAAVQKDEAIRCAAEEYKEIADMNSLRMIYQQELYRCAPDGLQGEQAAVSCEDPEGELLLRDTLLRLNVTLRDKPHFYLNAAGDLTRAVDETGRQAGAEELLAACCAVAFWQGEDVAVPYDAPAVLDKIAEAYGKACLRYDQLDGEDNQSIRRLARRQLWLRDGMMMTVRLLAHMKRRQCSLAQLLAELPHFAVRQRSVNLTASPSVAMQSLSSLGAPQRQGIAQNGDHTTIRIWPLKRGDRLRVLVEADEPETADELMADVSRKIADLLDS